MPFPDIARDSETRLDDEMTRSTTLLLTALLWLSPAAAELVSLDAIVAIVDESVITRRELDNRVRLVRSDFEKSNRRLPADDTLRRQVLELLITESLLLQEAKRRGIRITDSQVNQTMQRIARQNNLSLSDFRLRLIAEGVDYDEYRESVRRELTVSTLGRQYAQRNASVSDAEVDDFLERSGETDADYEYRLAHILIAVPDAASPAQVEDARMLAEELLARLEQGEDFDNLANTFSTGDTALQGGDLGWRKEAEVPGLFTDSVLAMQPGEFAGPIRSASGYHIVHLRERRNAGQVLTQQVRSRHILIRPNELISETEARERLEELRERILAGEDFARLARLYSVDYNSGAEGGDIGWQSPGATVPEYEAVASRLEIGELSLPFRSQFGWHLVEVIDRRTVDETAQTRRNQIYSQLLEQKQREAFDLWKQRLRDEAFVVFPDQDDA